jgi:hypothetical protein
MANNVEVKDLKDGIKKNAPYSALPSITKLLNKAKTKEEVQEVEKNIIRNYHEMPNNLKHLQNETRKISNLQGLYKWEKNTLQKYKNKYKDDPKTKNFVILRHFLNYERKFDKTNHSNANELKKFCEKGRPPIKELYAYQKYQKECLVAPAAGGKRKTRRRATRRRR